MAKTIFILTIFLQTYILALFSQDKPKLTIKEYEIAKYALTLLRDKKYEDLWTMEENEQKKSKVHITLNNIPRYFSQPYDYYDELYSIICCDKLQTFDEVKIDLCGEVLPTDTTIKCKDRENCIHVISCGLTFIFPNSKHPKSKTKLAVSFGKLWYDIDPVPTEFTFDGFYMLNTE